MPTQSQATSQWPKLLQRLATLDPSELEKLDIFLNQLVIARAKSDEAAGDKFDWPHAPTHRLEGPGTFIVTAGTLRKEHIFNTADRLDFIQEELFTVADQYGWQIEAWAIFSNHYHFVGRAIDDAESLSPMLSHLHANVAAKVNQLDQQTSRQVWHNFWETKLTFERSYLARLNYVHQNAVKHGLVQQANQYPWCSASWFERVSTRPQVKTIYGFKIDQLKVLDDFQVILPE